MILPPQVILGDSLEALTKMDGSIADLCLIDAPYFDYVTGHRKDKEDKLSQSLVQQSREDQLRTVQECIRVLKEGKSFWFFTNWQEAWWFQQRFQPVGLLRNMIIWDKGNWCLSGDTKLLVREDGKLDYLSLSSIYPVWSRVEVYTPDGFKPIKKMKVTATIYKNIEVGGIRIQSSPDHIFPIKRSSWSPLDKKIQELPIKAIKKGSLLWRPMEYALEDESRYSYESGWFTGFFLAEGYKVKSSRTALRFVTGLHESHYRRRVENYARRNNGTAWSKDQDHNSITGVHGEGIRGMVETFVRGKTARTKTLNMRETLNASRSFRMGLIDGFCDGDGTTEGKRIRLTTASKELSEQLMVVGSTLGVYGTRHFYGTSGFGGQGTWTVDLRTNTHSHFWLGIQALARIQSIQQIKVYQPMYDIQVEGGLFCISHGILTHNSAGDLEGSLGNKYEIIFLGVKGRGWKYKGDRIHDIWEIPRVGTNRIHSTEKPVDLYKKIIELSTNEGDLIIDPYGGSGASVIAAMETRRNIICYEIDKEYHSRIKRRVEQWLDVNSATRKA